MYEGLGEFYKCTLIGTLCHLNYLWSYHNNTKKLTMGPTINYPVGAVFLVVW